MKRFICIASLLSLIVSPGASVAMDCRLGEKYYHQAGLEADPNRSIEWLQRSVKVCPNFNAWYMLGLLYKSQGRMDQAVEAFTQAGLQAGRPQAEALALARKGEILADTGKLAQAIRYLELAERFHPQPTPDWLEISLKNTRLQYYRTVIPANDIAAVLDAGTRTSSNGRFVIRPAVNLPVHFDFDRADLNSKGTRQVMELGQALTRAKMSQRSFLLVGHTDKRGARAYNQILSEKRAQTVKRELERRFPILVGRLKAEGRGETKLLYDGDSEVDHMLNRRVKVTLIQ